MSNDQIASVAIDSNTIDLDQLATGTFFAPVDSASIMMLDDDEPIMMEVVEGLLADAGYQRFIKLSDPREAIETLLREQPDVLLLDLKMPHLSGFDVLKAMREDPSLKYLPVVVLTSSTDAENKLKALEYGATDFLGKPVDPSELVLRLRNTLAAKAYQDNLAFTDSLTGLPNRKWFDRELANVLKSVTKSKSRYR